MRVRRYCVVHLHTLTSLHLSKPIRSFVQFSPVSCLLWYLTTQSTPNHFQQQKWHATKSRTNSTRGWSCYPMVGPSYSEFRHENHRRHSDYSNSRVLQLDNGAVTCVRDIRFLDCRDMANVSTERLASEVTLLPICVDNLLKYSQR